LKATKIKSLWLFLFVGIYEPMKETLIELEQFFELRAKAIPILDARSEGEFSQGHIPASINLPYPKQ
jgi:rhodanese-related sulfurtransferase